MLSRDEDGRNNASQFTTYWRQRFSIQLRYCNANVLARKMSRLPELFQTKTEDLEQFLVYVK